MNLKKAHKIITEGTTNDKAIVFPKETMAWMYELEISGQISDGMWENSPPRNHYRAMTAAAVGFSADKSKCGVWGFSPKRKYNFASGELMSVIGERMRMEVNIILTIPGAKELKDIVRGFGDVVADCIKSGKYDLPSYYNSGEKYWNERVAGLNKLAGGDVKDPEVLKAFCEKADKGPLSKAELKKELKEMMLVVNGAYPDGYGSAADKKENPYYPEGRYKKTGSAPPSSVTYIDNGVKITGYY